MSAFGVLPRFLILASALVALPAPAAAQQDFATCDADLPVCSGEINDCCHRAMNPIGANRAVIIPMDRCHQRIALSGAESAPAATSPAWCGDPVSNADDGQFQAYGLVYRLMQNGINVHWAINPTKDPPRLTAAESPAAQSYTDRDIDLWVLSPDLSAPLPLGGSLTACSGSCVDPVKKLVTSSATATADSYNFKQFPVRGGAFIIAPEDRARFNAFIRRTGEFAPVAGDSNYDFSAVDMYEVTAGSKIVYSDFRTAGPGYALFNGGAESVPVSQRIDYPAPRMARLAPAGASQQWLAAAKLDVAADSSCKGGSWSPADAVYCDLGTADIQAGALVKGNFQSALIDRWSDSSPCGDADEIAQVDAVRTFMSSVPGVRAGGSVTFMDSAISVFESPACGSRQPAGKLGTGVVSAGEAPAEPFILRRPTSQFMQWGDLPTQFASGAAGKWRSFGGGASGYEGAHSAGDGTLVRLVTEDRTDLGNSLCSFHKSTDGCDMASDTAEADLVDAALYLRYLDKPNNGIVFYSGGSSLRGRSSHMRLVLNSLLAIPGGMRPVRVNAKEKSRSARITAEVGGESLQFQGTFEIATTPTRVTTFSSAADATTFVFPAARGHLRAVKAATLSATSTSFENATAVFDAGADSAIPAANPTGCTSNFSGTCRTVFTTVEAASDGLVQRPGAVFFKAGNLARLKPLMGAFLTDSAAQTLISRVLAGVPNGYGGFKGKLGGVDRSTAAVIEASPLIASSSGRPTMIYVGAMDGMLHAFCAEAVAPCPAAGRELWAFIPRTQLPLLRLNAARIDGSPKVTDVFDDFTPGDGKIVREWRTVLTFQTGNGNPGDPARAPAAVAIDITDPAAPVVLWERTTRERRGTVEHGAGLGVAMAHARVQGQTTGLTYLQTNNGGTGPAGFWLAAVESASGALRWEVTHTYPAPRSSASPPVPQSGIPGGAVAVGTDSSGMANRVLVPSLHGALWQFDAASGANPLGAGKPLVLLTTDHHPVGATPTVYQHTGDGRLYTIAVSGSYVDPIGSSWAPSGQPQYLVSAAVETSAQNAPILESGPGNSDRGFVQTLGDAGRPTAQATVSGEVVARADGSRP